MSRLSGPSVAAGASRSERWLRADLGDTVRVAPRGDGTTVAPPAELEAGLRSWSGRLSRSRALVLASRWLLLGLILALVPAAVILATGGSRPWWLFAVVLVGPLAGLVAVARRPSAARTAQVLDRRLGLADRLTTALELRSAPVAPTGLGGLVVDEASSALGQSLGGARATARWSARDLAWLLAAAVALAVVIAVPRSGSTATATSTRASTGPGAVAGGGAAAATRSGPATPGRTTIPSATPLPRPVTPKQIFGGNGQHFNPNADPYGGGYRGARFQTKQQAAKPTGTAAPSGLGLANPGGATPGQGSAAGSPGSSSGQAPAPSGAGAGQSRINTPAGGANGQPASGSPSATGAGGAGAGAQSDSGASGAAGAPRAAAGARGTSSGSQSGSGGSSGGETAGGVRAARSHGVGLVPVLGGSGAGLPLQGSLAGSRAGRSGSQGAISNRANGGGGYARGVQASSGAGGVGGAGVNLPVLAPTFNSPSQLAPGLLQRYFGAANRLAFKGW